MVAIVVKVHRTVTRCLAVGSLTLASVGATLAPAPAATQTREITYHGWGSAADFGGGTSQGVRVARGKLRIDAPVGRMTYDDPFGEPTKTYEYGRWTSGWVAPGFGLTELVPSWDASTRGDSWIQVQVRGRTPAGTRSSWDTIARWAAGDRSFHRTSLASQTDDIAHVATDTWKADSGTSFGSWQLRLTLFRRLGTIATPRVDSVGAMVSRLPNVSSVATSSPGVASGITLNVPKYSQMTHSGEYPQYGGGGEAWCSPTSTSMVLGYYGALPSAQEYAWVNPDDTNRFVDHAARMTYDYRYHGTGNWPFNTAYAATHTGHAFVTRLRSLRQAERFIKVGIPVVASIAFGAGELDGAPITASNGHLLVIVGFTTSGDVVVNDPAAATNAGVRRVYDRGQFEDAWLPKSGGLVYVIRDGAHPLPERNGATNW